MPQRGARNEERGDRGQEALPFFDFLEGSFRGWKSRKLLPRNGLLGLGSTSHVEMQGSGWMFGKCSSFLRSQSRERKAESGCSRDRSLVPIEKRTEKRAIKVAGFGILRKTARGRRQGTGNKRKRRERRGWGFTRRRGARGGTENTRSQQAERRMNRRQRRKRRKPGRGQGTASRGREQKGTKGRRRGRKAEVRMQKCGRRRGGGFFCWVFFWFGT